MSQTFFSTWKAAAGGAFDEAALQLQVALELFDSIDAQLELAQTQVDLATVSWRAGDSIKARAYLEQAVHQWRVLEAPRWRERTERLAGEWRVRLLEAAAASPS